MEHMAASMHESNADERIPSRDSRSASSNSGLRSLYSHRQCWYFTAFPQATVKEFAFKNERWQNARYGILVLYAVAFVSWSDNSHRISVEHHYRGVLRNVSATFERR
jgi:hypothetical protein